MSRHLFAALVASAVFPPACSSPSSSTSAHSATSSTQAASGAPSPSTPGSVPDEGPFHAGVSAHASIAWLDYPPYPGARALCEHTSNGLPHTFTRVFVTTDAMAAVHDFYGTHPSPSAAMRATADGFMISPADGGLPRLELRPAAAAPAGCAPASGDATILVITERPPFPH